MGLYVLMYHGFGREHPIKRLNIDMSVFEEQLDKFREAGFSSAVPSDLSHSISAKGKKLLITMDDGMQNSYYASLLAVSKGFIPVILPITGRLDASGFLSRSQIRELAKANVFFGSHTHNLHLDVKTHYGSNPVSIQNIRDDLNRSTDILEDLTNREVKLFAYPFGHVDSKLKQAVTEEFDYAFGTKPFQKNRNGGFLDSLAILSPEFKNGFDNFEISRVYVRREMDLDEVLRAAQIPGYGLYLKLKTMLNDKRDHKKALAILAGLGLSEDALSAGLEGTLMGIPNAEVGKMLASQAAAAAAPAKASIPIVKLVQGAAYLLLATNEASDIDVNRTYPKIDEIVVSESDIKRGDILYRLLEDKFGYTMHTGDIFIPLKETPHHPDGKGRGQSFSDAFKQLNPGLYKKLQEREYKAKRQGDSYYHHLQPRDRIKFYRAGNR